MNGGRDLMLLLKKRSKERWVILGGRESPLDCCVSSSAEMDEDEGAEID